MCVGGGVYVRVVGMRYVYMRRVEVRPRCKE